MAFRWMAIVILALALAIGYMASINATEVVIRLPFLGQFEPTSGLLMILSFAIGILGTLIFFAVRDWQQYFRGMAAKKRERLATSALEKLARARSYTAVGMRDQAMGQIKEALARDPSLAEAHELMGDLVLESGDHYGAAASHNQALQLSPVGDMVRWKLSRDYQAAGNTALALRVIREGLESEDRSTYLLAKHRDLLVELRDWDAAIVSQHRLMKVKEFRGHEDPKLMLAGLLYEKGRQALANGQNEDAAKAFEEAIKSDGQLSGAYVRGGDAYVAQDKEKQALKLWALGYRRTSDPAIMSRLEGYYLQRNDPSRIINLYLRHIEEKPQDAELRYRFATLLFKLEMLQEAQAQVDEVRRLAGEDNPRVTWLQFQIKEKTDDPRKALEELKTLVGRFGPLLDSAACVSCGARTAEFQERCPSCGRWGSLRTTL